VILMVEDDLTFALFGLWGAFVLCVIAFVIYRSRRDPPPPADLSETSKVIARITGFPKLFDGLVARPMTGREKLGWLIVVVVMVLAALFSGKGR
jgi:hypothetical protein